MELHIIFFTLAALLVVILVGYSIWSSRREKSRVFNNDFSQRANYAMQDDSVNNVPAFAQTPEDQAKSELKPQLDENQVAQEVERSLSSIKISLQGKEPVEQQESHQLSFQPEIYTQGEEEIVETPIEVVEQVEEPLEQTIQLYVVAAQGSNFIGQDIVTKLEDLGLHYDTEFQIFQRHIDTAVSPTIFGVANMMQPGIFDLNKIYRCSTIGLVFFMNVPSVGNNQANFRLMLNCAESLAQSLGGFVLDEQRQLFDDNSLSNYLSRL